MRWNWLDLAHITEDKFASCCSEISLLWDSCQSKWLQLVFFKQQEADSVDPALGFEGLTLFSGLAETKEKKQYIVFNDN